MFNGQGGKENTTSWKQGIDRRMHRLVIRDAVSLLLDIQDLIIDSNSFVCQVIIVLQRSIPLLSL